LLEPYFHVLEYVVAQSHNSLQSFNDHFLGLGVLTTPQLHDRVTCGIDDKYRIKSGTNQSSTYTYTNELAFTSMTYYT
jgi:hypothetical protein